MTTHEHCTHPTTKSARARCRRQSVSQKPSSFMIEQAYAMNDMWSTLNSKQEALLTRYAVVHTTCECCDTQAPCFVFEHLGINVCGSCERTYDVHKQEEEYKS